MSCKDCSAVYIGQTKRRLKKRIKEHENSVKNQNDCAIFNHCNENNHGMNFEKVDVLDQEKSLSKRLNSEMIHIYAQESTLKIIEDTQELHHAYAHILSNFKNQNNNSRYSDC